MSCQHECVLKLLFSPSASRITCKLMSLVVKSVCKAAQSLTEMKFFGGQVQMWLLHLRDTVLQTQLVVEATPVETR